MDPSLIIGAAVALVLVAVLVVWRQPAFAFGQRSVVFVQHVRAEVRRITWPSWDDLRKSTIVITILLIIIGVVIGIMDWLFTLILIQGFGRVLG